MAELLRDFIVFLGEQNTYGLVLHLGVCLPGILWVQAPPRCVFACFGQQLSELPFVLQVVPGQTCSTLKLQCF